MFLDSHELHRIITKLLDAWEDIIPKLSVRVHFWFLTNNHDINYLWVLLKQGASKRIHGILKTNNEGWLPRMTSKSSSLCAFATKRMERVNWQQTREIYIQRGDDWLTDRATHANMRLIYSQWFRSLWVGVLELIDFLPSQNMKEPSQTNPHVGLPQN